MANKYKVLRVRAETVPNIKLRVEAINKDLDALGVKKQRMHMIDFIDLLATKPVFLSSDELIKLSKTKVHRV